MGEYLKALRKGENKYGKIYSQDDLGQMLNPPVYRSAIHKWESGTVQNIRRSYIEQLAEIFGVKPSELMCFESKYDEKQISEEVKVIESVRKIFGKDAVKLLQYFNELNDEGKQKALNNVGDLTEIAKYTESSKN